MYTTVDIMIDKENCLGSLSGPPNHRGHQPCKVCSAPVLIYATGGSEACLALHRIHRAMVSWSTCELDEITLANKTELLTSAFYFSPKDEAASVQYKPFNEQENNSSWRFKSIGLLLEQQRRYTRSAEWHTQTVCPSGASRSLPCKEQRFLRYFALKTTEVVVITNAP